MIRILLVCVSLVLTLSYTAQADEPSRVRYRLPVVPTNADGNKCLDTAQWNQVILVASEYKGLFDWRLDIDPTLLKYASLEESYLLQISFFEREIKELKDSREYLLLRLGQETKAKSRTSKIYKLEKGLMWGMIAIETVVIGILGIKGTAD